jgi:hypothetical protein
MKNFTKFFLLLLITFSYTTIKAQARLTIENDSKRYMTVKIMEGYGSGSLYKSVTISPYASSTIYFSESGYYFAKTMAILNGSEPVYRKGNPFKVTNDDTGYSVMTLTYSIRESSVPQVTGGKQISRTEFDMN